MKGSVSMGPILGILFAAMGMIIYEVPSLWKRGLKRELWVFSILLAIGTGLFIVRSLQMKIPSPLDFISMIYKPISDAIFNFLK